MRISFARRRLRRRRTRTLGSRRRRRGRSSAKREAFRRARTRRAVRRAGPRPRRFGRAEKPRSRGFPDRRPHRGRGRRLARRAIARAARVSARPAAMRRVLRPRRPPRRSPEAARACSAMSRAGRCAPAWRFFAVSHSAERFVPKILETVSDVRLTDASLRRVLPPRAMELRFATAERTPNAAYRDAAFLRVEPRVAFSSLAFLKRRHLGGAGTGTRLRSRALHPRVPRRGSRVTIRAVAVARGRRVRTRAQTTDDAVQRRRLRRFGSGAKHGVCHRARGFRRVESAAQDRVGVRGGKRGHGAPQCAMSRREKKDPFWIEIAMLETKYTEPRTFDFGPHEKRHFE